MTETIINLDTLNPIEFFGVNNRKLDILRKKFPLLKILSRGTQLKLSGAPEQVESAKEKIDLIQEYIASVNNNAAAIIRFSPEAKDALVRTARTKDMLKDRLAGFTSLLHPALALLHQIAQVKELLLTVEFINHPAIFLETQIKNAYLEKNESPV